MKTADLITSFLSNEMNPEQERQFLLSVAASDSMRLSLKSHVMLDRISANQLHRAEVPVPVREAIFAQMSASIAATVPQDAARPISRSGDARGQSANSLLRKVSNHALVMVLTASGFVAGYLTRSEFVGAEQAQMQQPVPAATIEGAHSSPRMGTSEQPEVRQAEQPVAGTTAGTTPPAAARAEKSVARADREVVRSSARNAPGRAPANTSVRLKDGSVSAGTTSSPLDPKEMKNLPVVNAIVAAGVSKDSLDAKSSPAPSVTILPSIRTSTEEGQQSQPQQGD